MKRFLAAVFTFVLICSISSSGGLITITTPAEGDLGNLDHNKAYLWRINLADHNIPVGEEITSVIIKVDAVYNWNDEPNILHISMLDQKTPHFKNDLVVAATDHDDGTDYFSKVRGTVNGRTGYSAKSLVANWMDSDGSATKNDLAFTIDVEKFSAFSGNNNWISFGFDPDCHFFTSGIRLEITTDKHSVPEPSMFSLLGIGLLNVLFIRRKKI